MNYITINELRKEPVYHQLASSITSAIQQGILRDGDQLPTEKELMVLCSLSATVVRRAYQLLINQHLVHRVKGRGTFVTSRPTISLNLNHIFDIDRSDVTSSLSYERHIVMIEKADITPSVQHQLKCTEPKVIHLLRTITLHHHVVLAQHVYIPCSYLPKIKDIIHLAIPLEELLHQIDPRPFQTQNRFGVINLSSEEALLLGVSYDDAAHQIRTSISTQNGHRIAYVVSYLPGDYVELEMSIHE